MKNILRNDVFIIALFILSGCKITIVEPLSEYQELVEMNDIFATLRSSKKYEFNSALRCISIKTLTGEIAEETSFRYLKINYGDKETIKCYEHSFIINSTINNIDKVEEYAMEDGVVKYASNGEESITSYDNLWESSLVYNLNTLVNNKAIKEILEPKISKTDENTIIELEGKNCYKYSLNLLGYSQIGSIIAEYYVDEVENRDYYKWSSNTSLIISYNEKAIDVNFRMYMPVKSINPTYYDLHYTFNS